MAVTDASTLAPAPAVNQSDPGTGTAAFIASGLFLVAVWIEVIRHLQIEWSQNPQYKYGWSVPFLGVYLLGRRWQERPQPSPSRGPVGIIMAVGVALLVCLRFVGEANPDWRLLSWAMAGIAISVSLA